jgi:hypothetical protein
MKKTLIYLALALLPAIGCRGGKDESLQRQQQQYDTVQEGQTSSATSTIVAPGETAPPVAGMTNTNADTTTAFALPGVAVNPAMTSTQGGTIAGTLTVPSNSGPLLGYPANPPRPKPRAPRAEPPPTTTAAQTDTTATSLEGPPPASSTVPPTTDTAPPPPPDTQPPPTTTT